jgi:cyanate lyase
VRIETPTLGGRCNPLAASTPRHPDPLPASGTRESGRALLNETPHRGMPMPPTDPLIYRFYELVMVNGPALKAIIEEEIRRRRHVGDRFRSGARTSARPQGRPSQDHHVGKFLPYKYYGAAGNVPGYGYKAE